MDSPKAADCNMISDEPVGTWAKVMATKDVPATPPPNLENLYNSGMNVLPKSPLMKASVIFGQYKK